VARSKRQSSGKPKRVEQGIATLLDEVTTKARILQAAAALTDGRTFHGKHLRDTSMLLYRVGVFIAGVQYARRVRR